MRVPLYDGLRDWVFHFEPERQDWQPGNSSEFLRGIKTGLPKPLDLVFVKRLRREAAAHTLLLNLIGKRVSGMPMVLGYSPNQGTHLYFYEHLSPGYILLRHQLTNITIFRPEVVAALIKRAVNVFMVTTQYGYVYVDLCTKNIMLDYDNRRIAIIDIDSAWPITELRKNQVSSSKAAVDFCMLWHEEIDKIVPKRRENAQKTIILSFAAVWSRASALAHHPKKPNSRDAVELVLNPGYNKQRALWDALKNQNKEVFLRYFGIKGAKGAAVYNQWREMFKNLQSGRVVPWEEILDANERLLAAISEVRKPQARPSRVSVPPVAKTQGQVRLYPVSSSAVTGRIAKGVWTARPAQTQAKPPKGSGKSNGFFKGLRQGFIDAACEPPDLFLPLRK